jgi:hypothetical protein
MLLSVFLENVISFAHTFSKVRSSQKLAYGYAEWLAGSTLQLQRQAHESLGLGTWSRTDETIPVTEPRETLGVLNTENPKYARLVRARAELSVLDEELKAAPSKKSSQYLRVPSNEQL